MLSYLALKLDLLIRADGRAAWLDEDEYRMEVEAGTFPPPAVKRYRVPVI
jgi:hypothetical protein